MNNFDKASVIAGLDVEQIDFAVLVGALVRIKRWTEHEPKLLAAGKRSGCGELRTEGQKAILNRALSSLGAVEA